jgi:protein SMG6
MERERERDGDPRERESTNAMSRGNPLRQLFDLISVLSCATVTHTSPKHPPNDHVSASSTSASSYATSISSSAFTLFSMTDGSSASSALFEGCDGNSVFSIQLKELCRALSNLETVLYLRPKA